MLGRFSPRCNGPKYHVDRSSVFGSLILVWRLVLLLGSMLRKLGYPKQASVVAKHEAAERVECGEGGPIVCMIGSERTNSSTTTPHATTPTRSLVS